MGVKHLEDRSAFIFKRQPEGRGWQVGAYKVELEVTGSTTAGFRFQVVPAAL